MSKSKPVEAPLKVVIIGAGVSGICTGIQLQSTLGIHDYTIFEENDDIGGTWLVNTYPGCACDIPSLYYSFSFEQNPNWSETFSAQPEILNYLRSVAKKYDIYKKTKFRTQVKSATWDETISMWRILIKTRQGKEEEHLFHVLVSCVGGLRVPKIPEEFEAFKGTKMHSARWDHNVSLKNKKVSIVGTGASAVQIIPTIVDDVKSLTVYQRNPPWVVPRNQMSVPNWLQWVFANVPGVQKALRSTLFILYEVSHNIYMKDSFMGKMGEMYGKFLLSKEFKKDEEEPEKVDKMRKELVPKYRIGCKRITPSDTYYAALSKPNVKIVTSKITDVKDRSIVTEDGNEERADVLVLATGFKVQEFTSPLQVLGKDGFNLLEDWRSTGPMLYKGTCASVLPNFFFVLGPNAVPGNTSAIFSIECQVNWIVQLLKEMLNRKSAVLTVDPNMERAHMKAILSELENTVWAQECGNWYTNDMGVVTTLSPYNGTKFWRDMRSPDFSHFSFA